MTVPMDAETLWLGLAHTAATRPGLPCLQIPPRASRDYVPDGLLWNYGEVAERTTRLVETYAAAGYGHGHRVSLLLENRPEFMLHFLALNALGCWVVPLNPEFRQDDLAFVLSHSEVDAIVSLELHIPLLQAAIDMLGRPLPRGRRCPVRRGTPARGPSGDGERARTGFRECADVHIRHHRNAEGLHHLE